MSSRRVSRASRAGVVPVSSGDTRARVRLSGPGAIVSCLPQLIGFRPVESLVLIGLRPGRGSRKEVGLTLRVDLDDVEAAIELARDHGLAPCHPLAMASALVRNRCVAALVVVVSDRAAPPPDVLASDPDAAATDLGSRTVDVVAQALDEAELQVVDAVLVRDGRWWSYHCSQPTCCPRDGTLVTQAAADLYAAELAWAGEPNEVLAGREVVVAKVTPGTGPGAPAVASLLGTAPPRARDAESALAGVAALVERFASGATESDIDPESWARLLVDLRDIHVRDGSLGVWKGDVGAAVLALWCAAARVAPPGFVAAPATLAALVAHTRGDGALASESVGRALDDDRGYRLALYSAQALGGGLSPTQVRRMLVESTRVMRARGEPVLDSRGRLAAPKSRR